MKKKVKINSNNNRQSEEPEINIVYEESKQAASDIRSVSQKMDNIVEIAEAEL